MSVMVYRTSIKFELIDLCEVDIDARKKKEGGSGRVLLWLVVIGRFS